MTYLDLLYGKCDIGKLEEYGIRLIALPTIGKEYRRIVEKAVRILIRRIRYFRTCTKAPGTTNRMLFR
jgi:hypothetical protein